VAAWTFQETLVLRVDKVEHHRVNDTKPSEHYTNNDQLVSIGTCFIGRTHCLLQVYTAHISKYNAKKASWEPYSGLKDLQMEFTMLDPHIRTALPPVAGEPGKYSVTFRAPDRHGVFKFIIDYKRKGWVYILSFKTRLVILYCTRWTHLYSSTTVPIVPPRHDGYPRFLSAAWPYYAGAISTSVGFFLFSAIWLAGEVRESSRKPGKAGKSE